MTTEPVATTSRRKIPVQHVSSCRFPRWNNGSDAQLNAAFPCPFPAALPLKVCILLPGGSPVKLFERITLLAVEVCATTEPIVTLLRDEGKTTKGSSTAEKSAAV